MKAIGLGHHTQALAGCRLITMENGSLTVTGVETVVGLNMTTAGNGTETGILIETETAISSAQSRSPTLVYDVSTIFFRETKRQDPSSM